MVRLRWRDANKAKIKLFRATAARIYAYRKLFCGTHASTYTYVRTPTNLSTSFRCRRLLKSISRREPVCELSAR